MRTSSHIRSVVSLVDALVHHASPNPARAQSIHPIVALAEYTGLNPESADFVRILQWLAAFFADTQRSISEAAIEESVKAAAFNLTQPIFAPFRPPFENAGMSNWAQRTLSDTNRAYFDLLSNVVQQTHPIFVPTPGEFDEKIADLKSLILELDSAGLPRWIQEEFKRSLELAILAVEKLPFLAHLLVADSQRSLFSLLLSDIPREKKALLVKGALIVQAIVAAYVLPYETWDATSHYYEGLSHSLAQPTELQSQTQPLALPAPASGGSKSKSNPGSRSRK